MFGGNPSLGKLSKDEGRCSARRNSHRYGRPPSFEDNSVYCRGSVLNVTHSLRARGFDRSRTGHRVGAGPQQVLRCPVCGGEQGPGAAGDRRPGKGKGVGSTGTAIDDSADHGLPPQGALDPADHTAAEEGLAAPVLVRLERGNERLTVLRDGDLIAIAVQVDDGIACECAAGKGEEG